MFCVSEETSGTAASGSLGRRKRGGPRSVGKASIWICCLQCIGNIGKPLFAEHMESMKLAE